MKLLKAGVLNGGQKRPDRREFFRINRKRQLGQFHPNFLGRVNRHKERRPSALPAEAVPDGSFEPLLERPVSCGFALFMGEVG